MLKPSRLFASWHHLHKTKSSRSYPAGMYWKWHFTGIHSHPINVGEVGDGIHTQIGLQNLFSFPPGLYKRLLRFASDNFFSLPALFDSFNSFDSIQLSDTPIAVNCCLAMDIRTRALQEWILWLYTMYPQIRTYVHMSTIQFPFFPLIDTHTSCIVSCALLPRNAIL